mgnify:CR=1 FL=1
MITVGNIAELVQTSRVALRVKTFAATGGAGNPVCSTMELGGSIVTALTAIFIPIVCLVLIVLFLFWVTRKAGKLLLFTICRSSESKQQQKKEGTYFHETRIRPFLIPFSCL